MYTARRTGTDDAYLITKRSTGTTMRLTGKAASVLNLPDDPSTWTRAQLVAAFDGGAPVTR